MVGDGQDAVRLITTKMPSKWPKQGDRQRCRQGKCLSVVGSRVCDSSSNTLRTEYHDDDGGQQQSHGAAGDVGKDD